MINIIIYIILSIVAVIANFCALLLIGDTITIIWTWFKKKEICETKKELLFSNTTGLGLIFMLDVIVIPCMYLIAIN